MLNPLARDLDHVLSNTKGIWNDLRNQRIFITGGTGFFGCWLLESFAWINDKLDLNAKAVVLTRNRELFKKRAPHLVSHPAIDFHLGDVTSFEFPKGSFRHVIHAASEPGAVTSQRMPTSVFDVMVQGTRHTLDFAAQSGAHNFLLVSSGAVYGDQPETLTHVSEDHSCERDDVNSVSTYAEGKRAAELISISEAKKHKLQIKIARCFSFVGPYLPLDGHFAVGNFISDALGGGTVEVKGDGTPYRSYLYAADLAIWLWTILLRGKFSHPYNVGSEDEVSISQCARLVANAFEPERQVHVAGGMSPSLSAHRYVPSTERAKSELGLKQSIGLSEGIKRTVRWCKEKSMTTNVAAKVSAS